MIALLLAIACSFAIALILRVSEIRNGNRLVVAGTNYVIAASLGLFFGSTDLTLDWILFGIAVGFGFVAGFLLLMRGMRAVGIAVTASVARIATLGPVLLTIFVYNEHPTPTVVVGIFLGLLSFLLLGIDTASRNDRPAGVGIDVGAGGLLVLVAILFVMTGNDFAMKIAQQGGVDRGSLLLVIFAAAGVICWTWLVFSRQRQSPAAREPISRSDLLRGAALGIPNFFSSWFLIAALDSLSAAVVFPVSSATGVILSAIAGVLFWQERQGSLGWLGIGVAIVAVVLMGIG